MWKRNESELAGMSWECTMIRYQIKWIMDLAAQRHRWFCVSVVLGGSPSGQDANGFMLLALKIWQINTGSG